MDKYLTIKEMMKRTGISSKEKIKKLEQDKLIIIDIIDGKEMISQSFIDIIKEKATFNKRKVDTKGITFRQSNMNDYLFIAKLIKEGVQEGHYKKDLISNETVMRINIQGLINGQRDILKNRHIQTRICLHNNDQIGFITLAVEQYGMIEFWYFSLEKCFQSKGFGTKIIHSLEQEYESIAKKDHPIFYARCSDASQAMITVLKKSGYDKLKGSEEGWNVLAKTKDAKMQKSLQDMI